MPKLKAELGYKNDLAIPKIDKIIINAGIGQTIANPQLLEETKKDIAQICGQKPIITFAKRAISGFKIRKGAPVGLKVTLRGDKMYDFLDRLINIVMPRIRDFRGVKKTSLDEGGNLNIGIKEHLVFPEIKTEKREKPFSLEVTVVTTAKDKRKARKLFENLGMIFEKKQLAKG